MTGSRHTKAKSRPKTSAPTPTKAASTTEAAITDTLVVHKIGSILEYTGIVADLNNQMWFRGHGMGTSYTLLPSLYRKRPNFTGDQLFELEHDMIGRFRERSTPFVGNKFVNPGFYDDLSILFYMQHYGIPTRLLDWSENPFVGLYFALNDPANYDPTTSSYKEDACVWMLNPVLWNNSAIDCRPPMGLISVPNADPVNGYLPNSELNRRVNRHRPPAPIAITGFHNSPRIIAQRGVFMLFGADNRTMDYFYRSGTYAKDCLVRIDIDRNQIDKMRNSLYHMGIADSVIYPDMHGFSAEISKFFEL